ncbi:MAG TPA: S9 family peptidase [Thermomicrobiales bacterium]|nr:S9 family peptidase [Thermomicrobiales bacterium]
MTHRRRLTAEILADLTMPSEPQVSPDWSWLTASVTTTAKPEQDRNAAIWLADTSGQAAARQITTGLTSDTHPRWSPDSRQLAFLSDRRKRGKSQLQLLSLDGGEASELTDVRGGVAGFAWLPGDERRIAYLALDARDEEEEKRRDERDDANVYGAFWPLARIVVRDLDSGDEWRIDTGNFHVREIEPSPDGNLLGATISDTPEIDSGLATGRLVTIDLRNGHVREIVPAGIGPSSVVWSLDGRRLFFIGAVGPTWVSSHQLFVVDADGGGEPHCVTLDAPYCFSSLTRAEDGDDILALVATGVESEVYRIDPESFERTLVTHVAGDVSGLTASHDGSVLGMIASTPDRPDDLYAMHEGGAPQRVSDLHAVLDDIAFGPQEVLTWERSGVGLDGILIWPPDTSRADGPLPCVVSIHGGPYGRWPNEFITRFGRWIAQHGYLVFLPNPRGGAGHGVEFAGSVRDTVGNDDYLDIMSGVDLLIEQGLADPVRIGCGGWSQGGFMTAWIVGHTDRFKAGVMGAGVSDWGMMIATSDIPAYEQHMGGGNPYEGVGPHSFDAQSPASFVSKATTPVLIVHGENDERVPVTQGIHFFRGLRRYGVPTELVTYPREPHGIQERNHQIDLNNRIIDWFQRWIPITA